MIGLENKTGIERLNLKELRETDKRNYFYALNVISMLMGRRLSSEEVGEIYSKGLPVSFRGGAPLGTSRQDYFLFYLPSNGSKPKLNVDCLFSTAGHPDIIDSGSPIVGGSLIGDRFSQFSSTWMKEAMYGKPSYNFGEAVNKVMLNHFRLKQK